MPWTASGGVDSIIPDHRPATPDLIADIDASPCRVCWSSDVPFTGFRAENGPACCGSLLARAVDGRDMLRSVRNLSALLAAAALSFPLATSAQSGFTIGATSGSPNPVVAGSSTTITTQITSTGGAASGILIDLEIYSSSGTQVLQQVTSGQSFAAGQQKTFQWTWAVPAGQAAGSYRVAVGVFSGDWATLYTWANQATTVSVQTGGAPPAFAVGTGVAAPNPVTRGSATTISVDVTDTGGAASGILIDLEIYSSSGTQVLQQVTAGQSFGAGERKTFQWTWAVPTTQATGAYRVAVGVFSAGWTTLYTWTSQATTVTVQSVPATATLTVSRNGTGTGRVTSAPAGIDCGTACTTTYPAGTVVTLTATPDAGSTFGGWSGGGCSGTGTCQLTLSASATVTASFTGPPTLTVTRSGSGTGRVTSAPAGIDCGTACTTTDPAGTVVALTATA